MARGSISPLSVLVLGAGAGACPQRPCAPNSAPNGKVGVVHDECAECVGHPMRRCALTPVMHERRCASRERARRTGKT